MTFENEKQYQANLEKYTTATGLVLSSGAYNAIKWFVLIFLPAASTLYSGAALLFNLPFVAQVVGALALLAVFLGTILGISNSNFQKGGADGSINAQIEGKEVVLSNIVLPNITPEELASKKSVQIQINPSQTGLSQ